MIDDRYNFESSANFSTFEFESIGPKGIIAKVIRYREINVKGVFNLGFGDEDPVTGYVSDLNVTDNKDSDKVLATVARTLYVFTAHYPKAIVIATGSTEARTRLYRIGITKNLEAIEKDFVILGLIQDDWELFRKNVNYGGIFCKKKIINLYDYEKAKSSKSKFGKGNSRFQSQSRFK